MELYIHNTSALDKKEIQVSYVMKGALSGLRYLHVVKALAHRDIKPENMLIGRVRQVDGIFYVDVKISDFGIAKLKPGGTYQVKMGTALIII